MSLAFCEIEMFHPPKPQALGSIFSGSDFDEYEKKISAHREEKKKEAFSEFLDRLILFKNPTDEEIHELSLVIRTHLFTEQSINALINRKLEKPLRFEDWTYSKKVDLLSSLYSEDHIPQTVRRGLRSLNRVRNNVAHIEGAEKEGAIIAFQNDMFSKEAIRISGDKSEDKNLETACFRIVESLEWIMLHFKNRKIEWSGLPDEENK